mgnify:CR=1 FL=1
MALMRHKRTGIFLRTLAALAVLLLFAGCQDKVSNKPGALPSVARNFIRKQLRESSFVYVRQGYDLLGRTNAEVLTKTLVWAQFNSHGDWIAMENWKGESLPEKALPPAALEFVKTNYPAAKITQIRRDKITGLIVLNDGTRLTSDPEFKSAPMPERS